ncbi:MAG: sulfatase [Saprospiraceae bacterium]
MNKKNAPNGSTSVPNLNQALPNIIFYLADDQDIYDYGCYGNDKVQTPAVDRLAKEGMLFTNTFTGQAICSPSRTQLYSGLYPLKNGVFKNHTASKSDLKSVTKYMRELGYEVILAGKSHVNPPVVYDWDKTYESIEKEGTPRKHVPLEDIESFFSEHDKPFCLIISSFYPHGEYFDDDSKKADDIKFYPFDEHKKNNPAYVAKRSGYYRSILEDNNELEIVLDLVDQHLDDNTLFIYSADHGVSGKFTVYDRGLRVPFIARWPGVIKAGSQSDVLTHYTDVLPTFIDLAGGSPNPEFDGKSFLHVLKGEEKEIHEYVYGVRTSQNIRAAAIFPSRMIRNKQFKYIRNFNSIEVTEQNFGANKYVNAFIQRGALKFKDLPFEELYNIEKDPFEQNNLAKDPAYQAIKEKLIKDLFIWMKDQGDFLPEQPGFMPILTAKNFKLDQEDSFREVPDSLENTLKKEDYFYLPYEK